MIRWEPEKSGGKWGRSPGGISSGLESESPTSNGSRINMLLAPMESISPTQASSTRMGNSQALAGGSSRIM
eukprot:CAMPEP_0170499140 /NCGR_PEP_ID=MMETSP0208-20121228/30269_1 /TAXON_ID=197538 /ORGANISM="Strombidium inclinatum, Strain S3" /LENGTH=70 /DNA_ID=CAMNT_0010776579 /DNA_START=398 /DNA_END=610 /DNA_ORIENTATION=+